MEKLNKLSPAWLEWLYTSTKSPAHIEKPSVIPALHDVTPISAKKSMQPNHAAYHEVHTDLPSFWATMSKQCESALKPILYQEQTVTQQHFFSVWIVLYISPVRDWMLQQDFERHQPGRCIFHNEAGVWEGSKGNKASKLPPLNWVVLLVWVKAPALPQSSLRLPTNQQHITE